MNDYQKLKEAGFSDYETMGKNQGVKPVEISKNYFFEMLEVLPPAKWTRSHSYESFYIIEALTGNLHQWLIRFEDRYFTLIASKNSTHEQIVNKVKESLSIA